MAHVFERRVDGKDQVELRIDQGTVEVEDEYANGGEAGVGSVGLVGQTANLSESRMTFNFMGCEGICGSNFVDEKAVFIVD